MIALTRKVLCLDWDKRSLRLVVARVGKGRMVLEDAHSHRVPHDVDTDDPAAMGDLVQQMMRRHNLRARQVVVDVPRERTVINRMTLPPTPADEVAAAVRFQAMRELPFSLDQAAVDYVITRTDEKGLTTEVLVAAVMNETLGKVRDTCAAAGLTPTRIGLRPYANLVSASRVQELEGRRVMFIDVGPGATEIDIFFGRSVAFARSANVNVPVPTRDRSATGEDSRIISLAEIATLEAAEADEAIDAAVDELMVEVTRTLQAYRATESDVTIEAVIVAGGTGIESHFADALYRRLGVPVELFDPTGPLGVDATEAGKLRSFSAALGLAWGLSREGLLALDFLNPKRPVSSKEVLKARVRNGAIAAGVLLGLAAGGLGAWYLRLAGERDALLKANSELASRLEERQRIQAFVDHAKDWQIDAVWPDELLEVARAAIGPGRQMLAQSMQMRVSSNEQKIKLRNVQVTDAQVQYDFVRALGRIDDVAEPRFRAMAGTWSGQPAGEFKGRLDVDVELLRVAERLKAKERRDAERRRLFVGR